MFFLKNFLPDFSGYLRIFVNLYSVWEYTSFRITRIRRITSFLDNNGTPEMLIGVMNCIALLVRVTLTNAKVMLRYQKEK